MLNYQIFGGFASFFRHNSTCMSPWNDGLARFGYPALRFGPPRPVTPVVRALLVANGAAYLLQLLADRFFPFTYWFGLAPSQAAGGALWQLFTYMFLHGSLLHLLFNMLALWMFGGEVEERMGSGRFAFFYFFCGVGAGLCTMALAWGERVSVVGASGAIFGVLLAFAAFYPRRPVTLLLFMVLPVTLEARWLVGLYAGLEVLILAAQDGRGLGHVAHLGGLVFAGLFLRGPGLLELVRERIRRRRVARQVRFVREAHEGRRRLQEEVDRLLDKISARGMAGLTEAERKRLYEASEQLKKL